MSCDSLMTFLKSKNNRLDHQRSETKTVAVNTAPRRGTRLAGAVLKMQFVTGASRWVISPLLARESKPLLR